MSVNCEPSSLQQQARSFYRQGTSTLAEVETYLLAVLAGGSLDPSTLAQQAKCLKCPGDATLEEIETYLWCQFASGTGGGGGGSTCPDSDANNFLTAAGISDATTVNAICTLVTSLKSAGMWTLLDVIYPMVGGTSVTTSYNLKNPSTFRITWHGTMSFSASGVASDGLTGYGDTGYNATNVGGNYTLNSASLSLYCNPAGNGWLIGASNGSSLLSRVGFITGVPALEGLNSTTVTNSGSNLVKGFYCATRTNSATGVFYQPGNTVTANSASSAIPTNNYFVSAENDNGTADGFNVGVLSFISIGAGLNGTQEAALASAVTAFETVLSRN